MIDWNTLVAGKLIVYGLVDPRTLLVRYIGRSTVGLARPRQHGQRAYMVRTPGYKTSWIRELRRAGHDYMIVVLEAYADRAALVEGECFWIAYGRACGWPLTNQSDGGEGNASRLHTPEARAKMAASLRGRKRAPEAVAASAAGHRGKALKPEHLAKLRGRKQSPEHVAKRTASRMAGLRARTP